MNGKLLAPFHPDEIKSALFSMAPLKACGLDGFPAFFFQRPGDGRVRAETIDVRYTMVSDLIAQVDNSWKLENLQIRRLQVTNVCPFCHTAGETVEHLMRDCVFVQQLMGKLNLPVTSIQVVGPWKNWVASYFAVLSDRCKRILMVLYWSVWYSRNKMVHEGIKPVIEKSASFIVAFIHKQDNLSRVLTGLGASCESFWQAPSELVVKFNFDYAFRSGSITTGVVGRNNLGLIIASCSIQHENVADAFVAEALACRQVVWFARELGFSRVIIEGDSLTVIKKLNSNAVDRANKAAHALAYECRRFPGPCYWVEEAPVATTAECELDRSRLEQVSVP
ncbi:hypothetical protein V6N11_041169 [Hibiscus sabdariffa]|uniref:RNase H type-1 domain-containing protein n=1 Tax=Hibiscus sabdariffa TaxID=183260 RepID=A0ABR2RJM4_9ROSI